ncbi:MAG: hypothetical protein KDC13_03770 [Bacteroidetes bacterium]|nr:hypothetical protein [Bacteroidota bacterium]
MENLNLNSRISSQLKGLALAVGMIFFGAYTEAQVIEQSFKVAPPSEAQELVKDTVDNFLSFSPVYVEGKTYLRWLVENDKKDGVFIVERSADGDAFEALGFKDRVGTTKNVNLFYSFVDDAPPAGFAHYRIMQVGTDHTFNYSSVVRVKTGAASNSTGSASVPVEGEDKK